MILDAEDGFGFVPHAFDGLIVEINPIHDDIAGQRFGIDRESVILGSDFNLPGFQILDRMVGTAMAEFEFESLATEGLAENLVAEADAKNRDTRLGQFFYGLNRVTQG